MDAAEAPAALARLRPGVRIRLFWIEQGDRYAATGTLLSHGPAQVTLAPDDGGELTVPLAAVTCFYVPKPVGAPSLFARLRRALGGRSARATGRDDASPSIDVASDDGAVRRAEPVADSALDRADRTAAMRAADSPEFRSS